MPSLKDNLPRPVRSMLKSIPWAMRHATAEARALPAFIIAGAQKAGTTSLHAWLSEHPLLLPPFEKEVHFFDNSARFARGERAYRAHFPRRAELRSDRMTFETSPLYLFHPDAASRIVALLPAIKLIVLLRNPADRAVSHYFHTRGRGGETLELGPALAAEEQRLAQAGPDSAEYRRYSYRARGRYAEQLERLYQSVPRERVLVLESEAMFANPTTCLAEVAAFIDIPTAGMPTDLRPRNVGRRPAEVPATLYAELEEYFRPHNDRLAELLGRELSWCRRSKRPHRNAE